LSITAPVWAKRIPHNQCDILSVSGEASGQLRTEALGWRFRFGTEWLECGRCGTRTFSPSHWSSMA